MRLTPVLCKFKRTFIGVVPKFRGAALSGKHKFVPPATKANRYINWAQWRDQEEVMKYIATPYISSDEELDYLESMGRTHQDVDPLYTARIEPPMRQRYAIEILEKYERNRQFEVQE
jgi:hypothetical protein